MESAPLSETFYPDARGGDGDSTSDSTSDGTSDSGDGDGDGGVRRSLMCIFLALVVILVVLILYGMARRRAGFRPRDTSHARDLGVDLAAKGWVVFYLRGCPFCDKQRAVLNYPRFVELDRERNILSSGVATPIDPRSPILNEGFPFWYNTKTGARAVGLQERPALFKMAGL